MGNHIFEPFLMEISIHFIQPAYLENWLEENVQVITNPRLYIK